MGRIAIISVLAFTLATNGLAANASGTQTFGDITIKGADDCVSIGSGVCNDGDKEGIEVDGNATKVSGNAIKKKGNATKVNGNVINDGKNFVVNNSDGTNVVQTDRYLVVNGCGGDNAKTVGELKSTIEAGKLDASKVVFNC